MQLTEEKVRAFIDMYEAQYGVRLSFEDGLERAQELIALYEALNIPMQEIQGFDDPLDG